MSSMIYKYIHENDLAIYICCTQYTGYWGGFPELNIEHRSTQAISYPPVYKYGTNSQKIFNQADLFR